MTTTGEVFVLAHVPLSATRAWRDAATAARGQCTCAGGCGRSHRRDPDGRCARSLTGGYRLFLAPAGALLCQRCFDATTAHARQAARTADTAPEPASQLDLFA
jgi:hypothetical protein